jgi:hypothetical protein
MSGALRPLLGGDRCSNLLQSMKGSLMNILRAIKRVTLGVVVGVLTAFTSASVSHAAFVVLPGYDLFHTEPGTSFGGVPFTGVPLGTFNFGSGAVGTANTDTIVQRLGPSAAPGAVPGVAPPIPIEMRALQLMSVTPTNFGLGVGFYFITLQSVRGGPASTGTLTDTFGPEGIPHGTFDSAISVFFDVRLGSLSGPIALSDNLLLTSDDVPWSHFPPPLALEIPGVNTFLNGSDRSTDFFPFGVFAEQEIGGAVPAIHVVTTATGARAVSEPGTLLLSLLGVLGLFFLSQHRREQRPAGEVRV